MTSYLKYRFSITATTGKPAAREIILQWLNLKATVRSPALPRLDGNGPGCARPRVHVEPPNTLECFRQLLRLDTVH